jgi:L-alanine-DL-glutamate epimerase-like enolase superfamily enzyme
MPSYAAGRRMVNWLRPASMRLRDGVSGSFWKWNALISSSPVGSCGGITELIKISALADAHSVLVAPDGSSVYSYHFVITRHNSPFAEFLRMAPEADVVTPRFVPLLLDEPQPQNDRMVLPDRPGFGVQLNPAM